MQVLKISILITVFSFALFLNGEAQHSLPGTLDSLVKEIAASNLYEMGGTVGYAGKESGQYKRFEQLSSLATPVQLEQLASTHKNAVVRLYAFRALKEKKLPLSRALMNQFCNDHTIITTLKGCIAENRNISQIMLEASPLVLVVSP